MEDVSRVVGTCETMCPVEEFEMRQREGLLHKLELPQGRKPVGRGRARLRGDITTAVKEYSRPAAGRADPDLTTLRPPRILHQTINFLFNNLIPKLHTANPEWNVVYDFVFDRLRAVRQDMVIQGISGQDAICILEACVRFHVYAGYRLCEHKLDTFDPVINYQHTQECLKRLLYLYKQTDPRQMEDAETDSSQTNNRLQNLESHHHSRNNRHRNSEIQKSADTKSNESDTTESEFPDIGSLKIKSADSSTETAACQRPETDSCCQESPSFGQFSQCLDYSDEHRHQAEFETIYLLYNLGDTDAIRHFLNLPKCKRCEYQLSLAYQMSISCLLGNTLRVLRLASKLPSVLALCAFHRHLTSVQKHGLKILCAAFSSKNTRFPVSHLTQLLGYDSEMAMERACQDSGLQVQEGNVFFMKSAFKPQEKVKPTRWEYLEGRLSSVNLSDLLLGHTAGTS